ncbi:MAG: acyltransferase [Promethearchaeota archaeon]
MLEYKGFLSKRATLESKYVSISTCIYGPSRISRKSIIDSFVVIGYPIRAKTNKIILQQEEQLPLENLYDKFSTGSIIGENNHIRPFTTIYETSKLEDRVETGTNVVIRETCNIGQGSIIGSGTILDSGVSIGQNARIQSNNFIPPKIVLGDNVFLGPGVRFSNDKYPVSNKLIGTKVEDNVIIGIGAILMAGLTIGKNAVIAAGALITKDVPRNQVMMGVPAKPVMTREEYNQKQQTYENLGS